MSGPAPWTFYGAPSAPDVRALDARVAFPEVARRGRVVAFDVVELNPARDLAGTTARVAAWAAVHFLSEILDPSP